MPVRLPRRFSLFSAMVLVAAVAVALARTVEPYFTQRRAAAHLFARGYQQQMRSSWLSRLTRQAVFEQVVDVVPLTVSGPISDEDGRSLAGLPFVRSLSLDEMTDEQLFHLRRMSQLEHLSL